MVTVLCMLLADTHAAKESRAVTSTISGNVGVPNVVLNGSPGAVVSDVSGNYAVTVPYAWSGEIRPVKQGYVFEPASIAYANVRKNHSSQDYTATVISFQITGNTGISGVLLKGLPGDISTDANGRYSAVVEYGWSGNIVPSKEGYRFAPESRSYSRVSQNLIRQDYSGKVITYKISGNVGVPDATLLWALGEPTTQSDIHGNYVLEVRYGWAGEIQALKEGYSFFPPTRAYRKVLKDQSNMDYKPKALTFTVSGNTGMPGVVLKGLPENPVSDATGTYCVELPYGFSGYTKPCKEGYSFAPPERRYSRIKASISDQDFHSKLIWFEISGNVGVPGVLLLGAPNAVLSDARGYYQFKVKYGWKGSIRPSREGYRFAPEFRSYSTMQKEHSNENYSPSILSYEISGNVGMPGVVLGGLPGEVISDEKGNYSVKVDYGWAGRVEPQKEGRSFDPPSRHYVKIRASQLEQNYRNSPVYHNIYGSTSIPGVVLKGLPGDPVTGPQGKYKVEVPDGWCGIVIPYKLGHSFEPSSRTYPCVTESIAYENYLGRRKVLTISDRVAVGGEPISGVRITANNGGGLAHSDDQGNFRIKVPYGWSGNLSLRKEGYAFDPPHMTFKDVTQDIDNRTKVRRHHSGYTLGSDAKVLIVPISKITPDEFSHLVQDTNVMLHILRENINKEHAGPAGAVFSDIGALLGQPDCPFKAIYIQDYGILFSLEVDMPLAPPARSSGTPVPGRSARDSVWERAQRELHQPQQPGPQMGGLTLQQLDPDEVVTDLIVLLRHASNIRHLQPEDRIIVTLLGKSPVSASNMMGMGMGGYGAGGMGAYEVGMMMDSRGSAQGPGSESNMMGVMGGLGGGIGTDSRLPPETESPTDPSVVPGMGGMMDPESLTQEGGYGMEMAMMGGGMGVGGHGMVGGMGGYGAMGGNPTVHAGLGAMGMPGASFVRMVVTVHVKKSAIDDFAQGRIDFKQFRDAVKVFKY